MTDTPAIKQVVDRAFVHLGGIDVIVSSASCGLFEIRFGDTYGLRPSFIQPMRGTTSRMRSDRRQAAAMLQLAIPGSPKKTLNTRELNAVAMEK